MATNYDEITQTGIYTVYNQGVLAEQCASVTAMDRTRIHQWRLDETQPEVCYHRVRSGEVWSEWKRLPLS